MSPAYTRAAFAILLVRWAGWRAGGRCLEPHGLEQANRQGDGAGACNDGARGGYKLGMPRVTRDTRFNLCR